MNAMTSSDSKAGYRAAPTASQAPAVAVSSCDSGGLGSAATRSDPLEHHENHTTSGDVSLLNVLAALMALPAVPFPPTKTGGCYFVRASNGLVKIGTSRDIRTRLNGVSGSSPLEVELVAWFKCERLIEGVLHLVLDETRHHGEWFRATPELLRLMELMRSGRWRRFVGRREGLYESDRDRAHRIAAALRKEVTKKRRPAVLTALAEAAQ